VEYRKALLKPEHPLQVIVTRSGDIDLSHPIFNTRGLRCLVVTTTAGSETFQRRLSLWREITIATAENPIISSVEVLVCEHPQKDGIDPALALRKLKDLFSVRVSSISSPHFLFFFFSHARFRLRTLLNSCWSSTAGESYSHNFCNKGRLTRCA